MNNKYKIYYYVQTIRGHQLVTGVSLGEEMVLIFMHELDALRMLDSQRSLTPNGMNWEDVYEIVPICEAHIGAILGNKVFYIKQTDMNEHKTTNIMDDDIIGY